MIFVKTTSGKEVKYFVIGNGGKKVLLIGCMHGNEVGTSKLILKAIKYIIEKNLKEFTFYFIPILNPDGFEKALKNPNYFRGGIIGRTNCNNVDLNRNFNTKDWISHGIWEFGDQKITISGGKNPLSEPETRALVNFIDKNNIKIVFDFHNRVGTVLATGDKLGKEIAKIYCKSSGYKDITGTEWQNTGWIKNYLEEKDITYVEIETLKRWGSDWERNKEALIKSLEYIKTI